MLMKSDKTIPIGVNLRVTGHSNAGDRKHMEDTFSVACQQTSDGKDLEYAFFGMFDGHGGKEAALFAKEHLMDMITKQPGFSSDDDNFVLEAIRSGFLSTHQAMWDVVGDWSRTSSGFQSTAGTTASICFIKGGKMYVGHCGDSAIVVGRDSQSLKKGGSNWEPEYLTKDHKPEDEEELCRIEKSGGKVVMKNGVPRVVWHRPCDPTIDGPVSRDAATQEIPFLAIARALGDLWSYNLDDDVYVVSPEPDVSVYEIDPTKDRCIVLASDGALNVLTPTQIVDQVQEIESNNEKQMIDPDNPDLVWINPSKHLVNAAIHEWGARSQRADNTSVLTVMLDPPGPSKSEVLRSRNKQAPLKKSSELNECQISNNVTNSDFIPDFAIVSRFPNSEDVKEKMGQNIVPNTKVSIKKSPSPPALPKRNFPHRIENENFTKLVNKCDVNKNDNKSSPAPELPPRMVMCKPDVPKRLPLASKLLFTSSEHDFQSNKVAKLETNVDIIKTQHQQTDSSSQQRRSVRRRSSMNVSERRKNSENFYPDNTKIITKVTNEQLTTMTSSSETQPTQRKKRRTMF